MIGELALGNLRQRQVIRDTLVDLPRASVASDQEVLGFIGQGTLFESGIGYIDAHLLAATRLTADASCGRAISTFAPPLIDWAWRRSSPCSL